MGINAEYMGVEKGQSKEKGQVAFKRSRYSATFKLFRPFAKRNCSLKLQGFH